MSIQGHGRSRVLREFYDEDGIVIYNGDCRPALEAMDTLPALVLTDPPYGMDYRPLRGADGSKRWVDGVKGDAEPFDPAPLLRFPRLVLFGANWYADKLPASGGWLVWDKTPKGIKDGFAASHAELAWTNLCSSVRKFSLQWGGEARNSEPHLHPTQKPVGLMRWVLAQFTKPGDLVLDPYMGSGPVAQACKEMGRGYLGFEIDERYCEAAVSRLSQDAFDLGEAA